MLSHDHGFRDASTGEFVSHSALKDAATAASYMLHHQYRLKPQETVAIVSRNALDYPIAVMAASRLGAVVTALSPEAREEDLVYFFQQSSTVLVFADVDAWERVHSAAKSTSLDESRIIPIGEAGGRSLPTLQRLIGRAGSVQPVKAWKPSAKSNSICAFLAFTSGTTGRPKAVGGECPSAQLHLGFLPVLMTSLRS